MKRAGTEESKIPAVDEVEVNEVALFAGANCDRAGASHRGKRCEPAFTRLVAEQIAQDRGSSLEAVARQTTATAEQFFRLS